MQFILVLGREMNDLSRSDKLKGLNALKLLGLRYVGFIILMWVINNLIIRWEEAVTKERLKQSTNVEIR